MFRLLRIGPASAELYRQIRLNALQSDPLAFGSTYERESKLTPEDWQQRANSLDGKNRIGFFAVELGAPCALVLCFRDEKFPSRARVISMWVAPVARRSGLASALLEAVRAWAKSQEVSTLHLLVTSNNSAAIALYRQCGFAETGTLESYPNDPSLFEIEMERSVELPVKPPHSLGLRWNHLETR